LTTHPLVSRAGVENEAPHLCVLTAGYRIKFTLKVTSYLENKHVNSKQKYNVSEGRRGFSVMYRVHSDGHQI
jgi:hypothetical protein